MIGAIDRTAGQSRSRASPSSGVSVVAVPPPNAHPFVLSVYVTNWPLTVRVKPGPLDEKVLVGEPVKFKNAICPPPPARLLRVVEASPEPLRLNPVIVTFVTLGVSRLTL